MRRSGQSRGIVAAGLAALLAGAATGPAARAQTASVELPREDQALFERMFRNPSNPEVAVRYSQSTARSGDIEAAIGALERLLFYNPNLPRVRLELGILYYRLGSYEMAGSYLRSAIASPDVPAEVRERAEQFLAAVDRRTQPHQWSGFAQTGFRYQTNANVGPNGPFIRARDRDSVLRGRFVDTPDWNWFGFFGLNYAYDFGNQRGDVFEASLLGYYASQFRLSEFDFGLIELQAGPRLALAPDAWPGVTVKPYVIANAATLAHDPYLASVGGGVSLRFDLGSFTAIEPLVDYRRREFHNADHFIDAEDLTGDLVTAAVQGGGSLFGRVRWQSRIAFDHNDAVKDYYSFDRIWMELGLPWELNSLWGGQNAVVLTPTVGYSFASYRDPNPLIDRTVRRRDSQWRVGANLEFFIREQVGIGVRVQYENTDSTLSNYDTTNLSVTFGPSIRF